MHLYDELQMKRRKIIINRLAKLKNLVPLKTDLELDKSTSQAFFLLPVDGLANYLKIVSDPPLE
jgi:hypothetical protein